MKILSLKAIIAVVSSLAVVSGGVASYVIINSQEEQIVEENQEIETEEAEEAEETEEVEETEDVAVAPQAAPAAPAAEPEQPKDPNRFVIFHCPQVSREQGYQLEYPKTLSSPYPCGKLWNPSTERVEAIPPERVMEFDNTTPIEWYPGLQHRPFSDEIFY
jgi:hypothetical protein